MNLISFVLSFANSLNFKWVSKANALTIFPAVIWWATRKITLENKAVPVVFNEFNEFEIHK